MRALSTLSQDDADRGALRSHPRGMCFILLDIFLFGRREES
jgi:hypothetical protein